MDQHTNRDDSFPGDPHAPRSAWNPPAAFGLALGIHIAAFLASRALPESVTALGYVCAAARARTGSLRPAIAAHVMFNVGGFLGGLIYTIAYRVATGHLPSV